MFIIFSPGGSKFIAILLNLVLVTTVNGLEANIKSSSLKLTSWDREKIIFDHEFTKTAKKIKQQLIYNRPQHERYDMPLYAGFHNNPSVTIGLHFRLIEIVDLETDSEEMSLTYTLQLFWYDHNLAWYKPTMLKNSDSDRKIPAFLTDYLKNRVTLNSNPNDIHARDLLIPMQDAILELKKNPNSRKLTDTMDYFYSKYFSDAAELRPDGFYDIYDDRMRNFNSTEKQEFRKLLAAQFITVPSTDIWTPEIIAYNSNDDCPQK